MGRLVRFDALGVTLLDRERGDFRVLDVAARAALPEVFDLRMPLPGPSPRGWREPAGAAARGRRRHRSRPSRR